MRLEEIKSGKGFILKHKLMRFIMNATVQGGSPEVLLALMYKRDFFGKHMGSLFQEVMRGESELSVLQRELIATATSKANQCPFCTSSHTLTASLVVDESTKKKLDYTIDPENLREQVNSQNKMLMDFATKMTRDEITTSEIEQLKGVGFTKSAIEDAMYIVFAFGIINRLANSLDFELPGNKGLEFSAKMLIKKGYKI